MSKIEFSDVSYIENGNIILKNITLSIDKGELFMIKGSSLEQKMAFLMLAKGFYPPSEGKVKIDSKEDWYIGSNLIPFIESLTVREALSIPLIAKGFSKQEINSKIVEMTKYFSIDKEIDSKISTLKKQTKAILGVAKATIAEPSIVILNSFSSCMDHKLAVIVMTYLHEITVDFNVTVLLIEEDTRLHPFGSKILHLENGYIKELLGEGVDFQKLMPFIKI
jgi:ABC-type methionine transport system ATPase subunit